MIAPAMPTTENVFEPDQVEAEMFIKALTGSPHTEGTFQTFDDSDQKRKELARVLHGSVAARWRELVRLNRAGAGIFIMVNKGDGEGRATPNVQALRALFVDDDSGTLTASALELTPSLVVQSKNGIHAYWRLRAGENLKAFDPAQAALAAALGTDPKVKDLPRVMRVPGFFHMKDPAHPFMVEVVQTSDAIYTVSEVLEGNGATIAVEGHTKVATSNGHASTTDAFKRAQAWLLRRESAAEPGRNDAAYRTACHLRDFGIYRDEALDLMRPWNRGNQPPLSADELETAIANAYHYAKGVAGSKEDRPRNRAPHGKEPAQDEDTRPVIRIDHDLARMGDELESALIEAPHLGLYQRCGGIWA